MARHEFRLRPSTAGQERALHGVDELEGFSSSLEPDGYFHVRVEDHTEEAAGYRLRKALADLEDPDEDLDDNLETVEIRGRAAPGRPSLEERAVNASPQARAASASSRAR